MNFGIPSDDHRGDGNFFMNNQKSLHGDEAFDNGVIYLPLSACVFAKDDIHEHNWTPILRTIAEGRSFTIQYCKKCGIGLTDPVPTEATLPALYAAAAEQGDSNFEVIGSGVIDRLKDYFARTELLNISKLGGIVDVCRIADFGCGNGRYAIAATQVFPGAQVDAVDYQSVPPPALRDMKEPQIHFKEVNDWLNGDECFDLIVLRHVLEHNHDPVGLLRKLRRKLKPKGILYVEVPNLESWWVGRLGKRVNTLGVPFHLLHFTHQSLAEAMKQSGLDAKIRTNDMPLAGTALALLLDRPKSRSMQFLGIILHPAQMIAAAIFGKACLHAIARPTGDHQSG